LKVQFEISSFQKIVSLDDGIESVPSSESVGNLCVILFCGGIDTRFMFTPLNERAKNLDSRMDEVCQSITSSHNINIEDLHPVSQPLQSTVMVCGRICREEGSGDESEMAHSFQFSFLFFFIRISSQQFSLSRRV